MQNQTHVEVTAAGQFTTAQGVMNGTHLVNQPAFPGNLHHGTGTMHGITMEQVDPSSLVEEDSDSEGDGLGSASPNPITGLKPGKKTKGRVKIKMEFIENKLRRYTTFSKRKTGIMKKAYELSTLTGTQVMLLVASETGHVYTFATRKLQPMITSESGKALIQTCLNSPDPPPGSQQQSVEQRMNPTGFEETELTYAVTEEENKLESAIKPVLAVANLPTQLSSTDSSSILQQQTLSVPSGTLQVASNSSTATTIPVSSFIQQQQSQPAIVNTNVSTPSPGKTTTTTNLQMQIPGLPPGAVLVPPGTPLIPVQQNGQQITGQNTPTHQTLYRLSNSNQLVSISSTNDGTLTVSTNGNGQTQQTTTTTIPDNNQQHQQQQQQQQQQTLQAVQTTVNSTPNLSVLSGGSNSSAAMTPGVVMYQTPQGIVYAPTTATLADRSIFNFQQPAAALSVQQPDAQGQQIITIPVPVSLAGTPMVQFATSPAETQVPVTLSQPSAAKKAKK